MGRGERPTSTSSGAQAELPRNSSIGDRYGCPKRGVDLMPGICIVKVHSGGFEPFLGNVSQISLLEKGLSYSGGLHLERRLGLNGPVQWRVYDTPRLGA